MDAQWLNGKSVVLAIPTSLLYRIVALSLVIPNSTPRYVNSKIANFK